VLVGDGVASTDLRQAAIKTLDEIDPYWRTELVELELDGASIDRLLGE
jgi:hypothetical protein